MTVQPESDCYRGYPQSELLQPGMIYPMLIDIDGWDLPVVPHKAVAEVSE